MLKQLLQKVTAEDITCVLQKLLPTDRHLKVSVTFNNPHPVYSKVLYCHMHGNGALSSPEVIVITKCQAVGIWPVIRHPKTSPALFRVYSKRCLNRQETIIGPLRRRNGVLAMKYRSHSCESLRIIQLESSCR